MRATEILASRTQASVDRVAELLGLENMPVQDMARAMGRNDIYERLVRCFNDPVMREDLCLLVANPFDNVRADELVTPGLFEALAVVHRDRLGGDFRVNLDIAVASAPHTPFEFGFATTLLSRLDHDSLHIVRRTLNVGVRVDLVDQILTISDNVVDRKRVLHQIARLRKEDRELLQQAVEAGELPDDIQAIGVNGDPPVVELDSSAAGRAGLVFWVSQPAAGLKRRPVVPLELLQELPKLLEEVPYAAKRTRTRRSTPRSSSRSRTTTKTATKTRDEPRPSDILPSLTGVTQSEEPEAAQVLSRTASVQGASAVVDLENEILAEEAARDEVLARDILDITGETRVILRDGVDPDVWIEQCVLRLQLN